MSLILTVLSPTVRIRRGPGLSASILGQASVGEQYPVQQVVDIPKSREQWARVIVPNRENEAAYICVRTASGSALAALSATPGMSESSNDYQRGWNAALEKMRALLDGELKKIR